METVNPEIVQQLRKMARQAATVPQMVRAIINRLAPEQPHKVILIKYMREAFALSLRQASPIAGWEPDGTGELQDALLHEYIMPEILKNRPLWDTSQAASSA